MSVHLSRSQNKIRLVVIFLFTVLVVISVRLWLSQGQQQGRAIAAVGATGALDESLFMGLRHASAAEVRQVLPDAANKPAVLYFSSRLCHDCQRMAPVVSQVMAQKPSLYFKKVDVLDDHAKSPAIFRTFKPVSVPMVVLIDPQGEIRNVLYDYQKPEKLTSAIRELERQSGAKSVATKPASSKADTAK